MLNAFGFVLVALAQQKYDFNPKLSAKLVYLFTVMLAYVCYQMYSASLTSVFTSDKFEAPVNTLEVSESSSLEIDWVFVLTPAL